MTPCRICRPNGIHDGALCAAHKADNDAVTDYHGTKDTLKRSAMGSGRFADPWNVDVEDIHIEDIAQGLAHINRYNGQFGTYSVAQHSLYVADLVAPQKKLAALLHDAPEYLTGDLPHHIKHGRGFLGMMWRDLDSPIQAAVERRFGLPAGALYDDEIKAADTVVFEREWATFVVNRGIETPVTSDILVWDPETAKSEFLMMFNVYTLSR